MRIAKILALAVAGGMVLLPTRYLAEEQPAAETNVSTDLSSHPLYPLPFSFDRVLAYFNKVFGERPSKSDAGSYAYIDLDNPHEVVIITVTELQTSLGVVLFATGDYGVKYLREFFEAPFFLRAETEQLYKLLERGPGIRSVSLERFTMQMSIAAVEGWIVVAIEFSPPQLYRPHLALMTSRRAGSSEQPQFSNSQADL
jgi:hypothetical protein